MQQHLRAQRQQNEGQGAVRAGTSNVSDSNITPDDRTVIAQEGSAVPGSRRSSRREVGLTSGDILNGIYRVDRFIARGGMGEVFEGVNIASDERVAIKAMRSHLVDDPKVLAMFRKEAQVLTRIAHSAIVQYRVLARDPDLDLYYIVTDYIDGDPLSAHLDGTLPGTGRIVQLAKRLAGGLETAHEYGAVHRDMSPDNILLPEGRLERAKIIDFGIAKSLDISAETIVGDGFAGKLGYVAPEQFGDFDRQVGPWTDVYSTALVLLAFARGQAPDMGRTLSEAVERRREGPDLSDLPTQLEPLLRRMLVPDPQFRIRSMLDVLSALDAITVGEGDDAPSAVTPPAATIYSAEDKRINMPQSPGAAPATTFVPADPPAKTTSESARPTYPPRARRRLGRYAAIGGAVLILFIGLFAAVHLMVFQEKSKTPALVAQVSAPKPVPPVALATLATPDLSSFLATMPCSWVHSRGAGGDPVQLSGGTLDPTTLDDRVTAKLRSGGAANAVVTSAGVLQVPSDRCDLVDAMKRFDSPNTAQSFDLISATSQMSLVPNEPGCPGGPGARAEVTVVERDPSKDFALIAILSSGALHQIVGSRAEFERLQKQHPGLFQDLGDGRFQISECYRTAGGVGLVLIDASSPINLGLQSGVTAEPAVGIAAQVGLQGQNNGWRTRSVWVRIDPPAPTLSVAPGPGAPVAIVPSGAGGLTPVANMASPVAAPLAPTAIATAAAPDEALRPAVKLRAGTTGAEDFAACRRYTGQRWEELGYSSRAACVVRIFTNRCEINNGQFGNSPLRRYNGQIQVQRGMRWSAVARADECAAAPSAVH